MQLFTDIISFFKFLGSIPSYVLSAWRFHIVKTAWDKAIATFPGLVNQVALKKWATDNTTLMVQYTAWTSTTIDDYIAKAAHSFIESKWSSIWYIIQLFVKSEKVDVIEDKIAVLLEEAEEETSDPLVIIAIVSLIVQILALIYKQQDKKKSGPGPLPTPIPRIRIFKRFRDRITS